MSSASAPVAGVLLQVAGLLVLAQRRLGRRRGCRPRSGCRGGRRPVPAGAGRGCPLQVPGRSALTQPTQGDGEVVGRGQGVGVVVAQHPAAPGQGVLVQVRGPLALAQLPRVAARLLAESGCRGGRRPAPAGAGPGCPRPGPGPARARPALCRLVARLLAEPGCRGGRRPAPGAAGPGCPRPGRGPLVPRPASHRVTARLLAEVRVSGWSSPSTRRYRARVSSCRSRAAGSHPAPTGRGRGCWPRSGCRGGRRRAGPG